MILILCSLNFDIIYAIIFFVDISE